MIARVEIPRRLQLSPLRLMAVAWLFALVALPGCQSTTQPDQAQGLPEQDGATTDNTESARQDGSEPAPYLLLNQLLVEGISTSTVDLEDVDAMFWHVFSRLPESVTVYPSENYYYFIVYISGRQIWGNIRLPAGSRDRGVVSFGYFEFIEFPRRSMSGFSRSKFYTRSDGLTIEAIDKFTYVVQYNGKAVTFNLHKLSQEPPNLFPLGEGELFIERTFDESGYQFFLIFNDEKNYFFWVLNEEEVVPDVLEPLEDDLLVGKRSGFAFWVDAAHGDRKVLAAIRRLNSDRNDYYDGPFDQLADNYADEARISEYIQKAAPSLRGRIDKYGYYTDTERPSRVALSTYYTYFSQDDLVRFMESARSSEDLYQYISRRGIPLPPDATPSTREGSQ
jgi:hypothetical protein